MSKKSHDQKFEPASVATVTKSVRAARPRRTVLTGAGTKKVIFQSKSDRVLSLLKQANGVSLALLWQINDLATLMG